ncbi:MAG TPA: hypothetical protein VHF58_05955 [Solirubrobacterales bacterium]|nr:hypothetical protein [Solirubrobacterales bacterium]
MFWLRILAIAQVALLVRRHLALLEPDERGRLAKLVAQSKGRPRSNLTANEREELLRLVRKLEPGAFGQAAFGQLRGGALRKRG